MWWVTADLQLESPGQVVRARRCAPPAKVRLAPGQRAVLARTAEANGSEGPDRSAATPNSAGGVPDPASRRGPPHIRNPLPEARCHDAPSGPADVGSPHHGSGDRRPRNGRDARPHRRGPGSLDGAPASTRIRPDRRPARVLPPPRRRTIAAVTVMMTTRSSHLLRRVFGGWGAPLAGGR